MTGENRQREEGMAETSAAQRPAVPHICIPIDEPPFLQGVRCAACQEVFVGMRENCAKCGSRGQMAELRLSERGTVHTYSVVYRSFPGVRTPFVSAIVALEGGGNVQATIVGVPTGASAQLFGLKVEIAFVPSGQFDRSGAAFLAYHFKPASKPGEVAG